MRNGNLKIGEAAKLLDMNPRTIRFYESAGLLPPPKRTEHGYASSGQRLFTSEDLRRLEFVKQARLLELSLNEIKELLDAVEEGCCSSARPHLKTLLESKLPEIDEKIEALNALRRNLKSLHQRTFQVEVQRKAPTCAPTATESECVFVEAPVKIGEGSKQMVKNSKKA